MTDIQSAPRATGEDPVPLDESLGAPLARRWFLGTLAATLAFRLWLSAVFPFTPDEAYFSIWGRYPDLGYYDHPPMVGWWLAAIGRVSESVWVLRLAATLLPALCALLVRGLLRRWKQEDPALADWAAVCVLLLPTSVWNVLITTDTPLALFGLLSIAVFAGSARRAPGPARLSGFFIAGVLLGLAFTSKYFAVLLGLAYLFWSVVARGPGKWSALAAVVLGAAPFIALNLFWNYQACWCNVMFNLINRHEKAGWSAATPALYAATVAYLLSPLLWFVWRARARFAACLSDQRSAALLIAWAAPLALFAVLSLYVRIGLHWLLLFLPAVVLWLALEQGSRALARSGRILAGFALLHGVLAIAAAAAPLHVWSGVRGLYPSLVFLTETKALLGSVAQEAGGFELASNAYAPAAVLGFHSGKNVPVFGMGSTHARQDDFLTDWRAYDGRNIVIVQRGEASRDDYVPYFREVEFRRISLEDTEIHAVLGRGFDYPRYRAQILDRIRQRYYRVPEALPIGHCLFCERYFPGVSCRA